MSGLCRLLLCSLISSLVGAVYLNNSDTNLNRSPTQSYVSSNYTPAELNFNVFPSTPPLPGSLFIAPRGTNVTQPGPLIIDAYGELIWDGSTYGQTLAFSQQIYLGKSVIAMWVGGSFNLNGWGNGYSILLDETYTMVANITTSLANNTTDFHEFAITSNNTALVTVYAVEQADLTSYNVTATDGTTGWIANGYAQEIDPATGSSLFSWSAFDHVSPTECYAAPGTTGVSSDDPWDYFHINSIEKDALGNFLISSRHCHTVYYVNGTSGDILWRMGGMKSNFTMGNGTEFSWQHDARWIVFPSQMSLFDNAGTAFATNETQSRGLILDLDMANMTVSLSQQFLPYDGTISESQGSVQQQWNGNVLVGWGQEPYCSEYDANGTMLWSAQTGVGDTEGYRCLRANWTGYPTTNPSLVMIANSSTSSYDVYVSWNGATEVTQWEILGATSNTAAITSVANGSSSTFETHISVPQSQAQAYSVFQARALNANGGTLGYSDFVAMNGTNYPPSASETSQVVTISSTSSSPSLSPTRTPTSAAKASGGVQRVGRAAYWCAMLLGACVAVFGLFA